MLLSYTQKSTEFALFQKDYGFGMLYFWIMTMTSAHGALLDFIAIVSLSSLTSPYEILLDKTYQEHETIFLSNLPSLGIPSWHKCHMNLLGLAHTYCSNKRCHCHGEHPARIKDFLYSEWGPSLVLVVWGVFLCGVRKTWSHFLTMDAEDSGCFWLLWDVVLHLSTWSDCVHLPIHQMSATHPFRMTHTHNQNHSMKKELKITEPCYNVKDTTVEKKIITERLTNEHMLCIEKVRL